MKHNLMAKHEKNIYIASHINGLVITISIISPYIDAEHNIM